MRRLTCFPASSKLPSFSLSLLLGFGCTGLLSCCSTPRDQGSSPVQLSERHNESESTRTDSSKDRDPASKRTEPDPHDAEPQDERTGSDKNTRSTVSDIDAASVTVGFYHGCARSDAEHLDCWGVGSQTDAIEHSRFDFDQAVPPRTETKDVSAGAFHTCAVLASGRLACWGLGSDPDRQETDDSSERSDADQASPPDGQFRAVAAGAYHTCGVTEDHRVECWGDDTGGDVSAPQVRFREITAGTGFSCGIDWNHEVRCWGGDSSEQLATIDGSFTALDAGGDTVCGIRKSDRQITCWRVAGNSDKPPSELKQAQFVDVSVGMLSACGITKAGDVRCWGNDTFGQGTGPDGSYRSVAVAEMFACAADESGGVVCWGSLPPLP